MGKAIAMHARHVIARSPLDISELHISCHAGAVELTGKIKSPRGGQALNMQKEFEILKEMIRNTRGVKHVYAERVKLAE